MHPAEGGTGVEGGLFGLVEPVEHHGGVEVLADVVGALLAVLPSPCGVVEVVAGEVEYLSDHSLSVGVAAGVAPCGQGDGVVAVEHLLGRDEYTAGVIESAGHHTFVGEAADGAEGEGEAVFHHAGGVCGHSAVLVVGVGVAQRSVEAWRIGFGDGVEVLAAADGAESVGRCPEAYSGGAVAESARGHAGELLE